jgi:hypothetical protein
MDITFATVIVIAILLIVVAIDILRFQRKSAAQINGTFESRLGSYEPNREEEKNGIEAESITRKQAQVSPEESTGA